MNKWIRSNNYSARRRWFIVLGCMCAMVVAGQLVGCTTSPDSRMTIKTDQSDELEARWGVRVESIRLTAAGHLVDFRYRVIDPEKALTLMKRGGEAFLLDEATETKLPVPVTKVGQLRGTGTKHKDGRVYTVMFNSGNGVVQPGSLVTVVIGDFKAEHLVVE